MCGGAQEFHKYTYLWQTDVTSMFHKFLEQAVTVDADDNDNDGNTPPSHARTRLA